MPPVWCSLLSNPYLYDRPQPFEGGSDTLLKTNAYSRCMCGSKYNPLLPTSNLPCIIYGLSRAYDTEIEIQHCPICDPRRRKYIGPDLQEQGLFNWSNHVLFTHDLLDEYTSAYSTSETPFAAWVLVINSRYEMYASCHLFVSIGLFCLAWFAFAQLQGFNKDMTCKICGPTPDNVIWDGVTVAFSKKKILPSLQLPTTTSKDSPSHDNVRYYPHQQLIMDCETRQLVLKALVSHEQTRKQEENTKLNANEVEGSAPAQGLLDHIETVRLAEERLKVINPGLGVVFAQRLGSKSKTTTPAPAYFELFQQVSRQQVWMTRPNQLNRSALKIQCYALGQTM